MKIEYDHQADAVYLYLSSRRGRVWKSREIERGVIVDINKKKEVIGIELLEVSRRFKPTELFQFSVKHIEQPALMHIR